MLVAGSIALDTLEGEFGTVREELGGSALYFALAASIVMPLRIVAPVGQDAEEQVRRLLERRPVDLSGLSVLSTPTYRWHARHRHGGNVDLGSSDVIYDDWTPQLPPDFTGAAFIGSMRPSLQAEIAEALGACELLAGDAMQSYAASALLEVERLIQLCDWFFCNRAELDLLGRGVEPEAFREQHALQGLCLKAGADGSTIYTDQASLRVPALRNHAVVDTTGAGDALAGGFLAYWLSHQRRHDALGRALAFGTACASITIEDIGLRSLAGASLESVTGRMAELA